MIVNSLEFYRINPAGTIKYKVVSSRGVIGFSLTEKGKKYYQEKEALDIMVSGVIISRLTIIFGGIFISESDPIKRLREFCNMMGNDNISVSYFSYN